MARLRFFTVTALMGLFLARCGGDGQPAAENGLGSGGKGQGGSGGNPDASAGTGTISGGNAGTCGSDACAGTGGNAPDARSDAEGGAPAPYCGDGLVQIGVETCDDGNSKPGDGCS